MHTPAEQEPATATAGAAEMALAVKPASRATSLRTVAQLAQAVAEHAAEEAGGARLPPGHVTRLPPMLLVHVAARVPTLKAVRALATASRELHGELTLLRSIFAVARAMLTPRKPGRHLPQGARAVLERVECTPQAVVWLRAFVGGDAVPVLHRPDVLVWVVKAAATWRDYRTLDWLLGLLDPERTFLLRYHHRVVWDAAWLAAAGHAAGAGHVALTRQLLHLPAAPGQRDGLRRLGAQAKAALLTDAVTVSLGTRPHVQRAEREEAAHTGEAQEARTVAVLEALLPLLYLPYRGPPLATFPFGQPAPEEQRAEEGRQAALMAAAEQAMAEGARGAVTVLSRYGLVVGTAQKFQQLAERAARRDQADVLLELMRLPSGPGAAPMEQQYPRQVQDLARQAAAWGSAQALRILMDAQPEAVGRYNVRDLLQSGHVEAAIVVLTHPRGLFRPPLTDQTVLEALVRMPATAENQRRVWAALFAAGQRPSEMVLELAQRLDKQEVVRILEERMQEEAQAWQ